MRIAIDNFRGEIPRVTPRGLPDSAAQAAVRSLYRLADTAYIHQYPAGVWQHPGADGYDKCPH